MDVKEGSQVHGNGRFRNLIFGVRSIAARAALAMAIVSALTGVLTQSAQAQTYTVIYNFTGAQDGAFPEAGVTLDRGGNLYGTTSGPGFGGDVYRLTNQGGDWVFSPLYHFTGGMGGASPYAKVVFGPDGTLYGTAIAGGDPTCGQCGVAFNLRPPAAAVCGARLCSWSETVLYAFQGGNDGLSPGSGDLVFDQAGALYGMTTYGGSSCDCGTVYKVTPGGGSWTESVLHRFSNAEGQTPYGGVIFDSTGKLYGTTSLDVHYDGSVFQLAPAGGGWTITTIHGFTGPSDGGYPISGLISDALGNFYGTTSDQGPNGGGTVFELTPAGASWAFRVLYSFTGNGFGSVGPDGDLLMDGAGNLYGTTNATGAHNAGTVFKLTRSGGMWTYSLLHEFSGGSDGRWPVDGLTMDAHGNLYGTTSQGGTSSNCFQGCGVVFEISP